MKLLVAAFCALALFLLSGSAKADPRYYNKDPRHAALYVLCDRGDLHAGPYCMHTVKTAHLNGFAHAHGATPTDPNEVAFYYFNTILYHPVTRAIVWQGTGLPIFITARDLSIDDVTIGVDGSQAHSVPVIFRWSVDRYAAP